MTSVEYARSSQATQFPRRATVGILGGIIVCLLGFALAVWVIQNNMNERAETASIDLVAEGLKDLQGALSNVSIDYNHWDDAYNAVSSGDIQWLYDNYAATALSAVLFDGVIFFDGSISTPFAWTSTIPSVDPARSFLPMNLLARIGSEVSAQTVGTLETFDLMTVLNGQLVLLSATRMQPFNPERFARLDPAKMPIAILVNTLNDAELADLAGSLGLKDLDFTLQAVAGKSFLQVAGTDDIELGYLSWASPRPGSEIVSIMAPILLAGGVVFVLIGCFATWLASTYTRKLIQGEATAQQVAVQDPLTGLPNRRGLHQHVEERLARMRRGDSKQGFAMLLLDLDRFKPVNDLRGHQAGDLLLCEVASRLRRVCPEEALVSRLGGDEFVVAIEEHDNKTSSRLALQILEAISEPFYFADWSASISCSIGLAKWSEGASSSDLLREADQAMYRAKQTGRAGYSHYDETLGKSLSDRAAVEQDLRFALDRGAITPYFQSIYDVKDNKICGFEVLARWIDPVKGFVSPEIFIPLAEEIGQIDRLSEMVLDNACSALASWPTTLPISYNLSPRQFRNRELPQRILAVLARHGISGSRLEIEITERALMDDMEVARDIINEFVAAGVRISIDDFGTGTTSLAMLTQLSISKIKIDRSFIAEVDRFPQNAKIVGALLALAKYLDLDVTAEGIEREEELDFLREHHCTLAQGYLLGHPQSAESVAALLGKQPVVSAIVVPLFASG